VDPVIIENIFENLAVGLLVIDPRGEIILANSAASAILGRPGQVLAGKGWADLFLCEENDSFTQVIVDVIWEERLNLRRTVPYVRADGGVLQLSIATSYIRRDEKLAGIVVLLHDVTELHALHLQEKKILEDRNRLQMERTESLNKLAMAVAHQLRNPTTAIGGFAALMLKKAEPGSLQAEYLQQILNSTRRLENLVRSVHDYASLPPVSLRRVPVDVLRESMRRRVMEKSAECSREVELTIHADSLEVEMDPDLLAEALGEVLDNAVESVNPGGGRIEIDLVRQGEMLVVAIRDNGGGIAERDLPYVFDPFFTTKAVGVGMGLCRARRIIAEHGGSLEVESTLGTGTRVVVRIPGRTAAFLTTKGECRYGDLG